MSAASWLRAPRVVPSKASSCSVPEATYRGIGGCLPPCAATNASSTVQPVSSIKASMRSEYSAGYFASMSAPPRISAFHLLSIAPTAPSVFALASGKQIFTNAFTVSSPLATSAASLSRFFMTRARTMPLLMVEIWSPGRLKSGRRAMATSVTSGNAVSMRRTRRASRAGCSPPSG